MMRLIAAAVIGFIVNDVAVYCWHRWISHAGVLRWIGRDVFRRRHFHHHLVQYPPHQLHARTYIESCDITFGAVEGLLLLAAAAIVSAGVITLTLMFVAACGGALHGWLAIRTHELCHASNESVQD